jgi:Glycosyl transferases group 1
VRILSVVSQGYYGQRNTVEPMYLAFTEPLRALGHEVEHFDHFRSNREVGPAATGDRLLAAVRSGGYDAILYQTACQEARYIGESLREAGRHAPTIAWNSDDDFAWESQTSLMAPYFTFMFTTYPHIFEQNRSRHPNLRLSQWGCLETFGDWQRPKDLDFTFAGQLYGERVRSARILAKRAGMKVYGFMSGMARTPAFFYWPGIRALTFRFPAIYGAPLHYEAINAIWNRSRISYTPMEASVSANILQVKSRAFEQGLSGTLMVCRLSPSLERYYEPGTEFVSFEDLDDCVEKVTFYLKHEDERARIAKAYYERTRGEHMWTHRFRQMFDDVGLGGLMRRRRNQAR